MKKTVLPIISVRRKKINFVKIQVNITIWLLNENLGKKIFINYHKCTKSISDWSPIEVPICRGICFPDVSEPLAGVASDRPALTALKEDGNLQEILKYHPKMESLISMYHSTENLNDLTTVLAINATCINGTKNDFAF